MRRTTEKYTTQKNCGVLFTFAPVKTYPTFFAIPCKTHSIHHKQDHSAANLAITTINFQLGRVSLRNSFPLSLNNYTIKLFVENYLH